jgi:protein-tyrosine-phosphatase
MQEIYGLLRRAEVIVMATPVFFYGPTAQMKALIDRSQALWARRYVYRLVDPGRKWRRGFLLSLGATKGQNLFEGLILTAKYFFDAVGANFEPRQDTLTYRGIEGAGEIEEHPTALADAEQKAGTLITPFLKRKRVLFVSRRDACRSQIASAFAQYHGGDRLEVESAGITPAPGIHALMEEVMEEKGLDMAFRNPKTLKEAAAYGEPELIVSMDNQGADLSMADTPRECWHFPDPSGKSQDFLRQLRDQIEQSVRRLVSETRS